MSDASGGNLDHEVAICPQAVGHYESVDELFVMASNRENFSQFWLSILNSLTYPAEAACDTQSPHQET